MGKSKKRQAAKANRQGQSASESNASSSFQPLNMFFGPRTAGYSAIPSSVNSVWII
jgi:hypothetical protein